MIVDEKLLRQTIRESIMQQEAFFKGKFGIDSGSGVTVGGGSSEEVSSDLLLMPDDSTKLSSVHPSFRSIVSGVISKLNEKGFDPIIGSGYRSAKSQKEKIEKGYSKSKHLIGSHTSLDSEGNRAAYAVDIVSDKHRWSDTQGAFDFFQALGEIVESDYPNDIVWGGSWERKDKTIDGKNYNIGWDPAHIQYKKVTRKKIEADTMAGIEKIKSKKSVA